jgi:hypothetical protein
MKIELHSIISLLLIPVLFLATLPAISCTPNETATAVKEINVILTQATNIISVADPNASWVPDLKAAVSALQTSEAAWQSGGTVTQVINGLNTVEAILVSIPETNQYASLIVVIVAGIETVLAILPFPAGAVRVIHNPSNHYVVKARSVQKELKPHWYETHTDAFKRVWNKTVVDNHLEAGKL